MLGLFIPLNHHVALLTVKGLIKMPDLHILVSTTMSVLVWQVTCNLKFHHKEFISSATNVIEYSVTWKSHERGLITEGRTYA